MNNRPFNVRVCQPGESVESIKRLIEFPLSDYSDYHCLEWRQGVIDIFFADHACACYALAAFLLIGWKASCWPPCVNAHLTAAI